MALKFNNPKNLPSKAISIHQPYAWLVAKGIKDIENRSWYTHYRGPILDSRW